MSTSEDTNSAPANLIKAGVGLVSGMATYAVTSAVIRNNVETPETRLQKATLAVGSYVIGQTVAAKTSQWATAKTQLVIDSINNATADKKSKDDANQS